MLNDPFEDFGRWLETTGYEADFDAACTDSHETMLMFIGWWNQECEGERQTLALDLMEA